VSQNFQLDWGFQEGHNTVAKEKFTDTRGEGPDLTQTSSKHAIGAFSSHLPKVRSPEETLLMHTRMWFGRYLKIMSIKEREGGEPKGFLK